LTLTRVAEDGRYLAQCRKCGVWREIQPQTVAVETFFEILEADFFCCGLRQTASLKREKDSIDFH
jgi:hypothetical protein